MAASAAIAPRYVVIDSTGLKVFGAGEWYVRKHGMDKGRRRIWRKLQLAVDEETKEIVAVDGRSLPARHRRHHAAARTVPRSCEVQLPLSSQSIRGGIPRRRRFGRSSHHRLRL